MNTLFKICHLSLFILWSWSLYSQEPARDRITDTVKCRNASLQSYALYVPAEYDSKKIWPVILIFDPAARGRTGVESFVEAGRRYGFILACSNNSRNGPQNDNFISATAMFQDISERFSVDQKRIYASGFSGGSRFAMSFAIAEKRIAGVIGCGAGLPNDGNILPTNPGFLYYGMAGNRDMNYLEMYELHDLLSKKNGIISYLRTFPGGHQWPSPNLITEAVEWLILQSMNRKILPADPTFVSKIEKKTENLIHSSLSAGNVTDAIRYMRSAARDFRGTPFESGVNKMLADAEKSPEYKTAVRKWNRMISAEQQSREKYVRYLGAIFSSASLPDSATSWWKKEAVTLVRIRQKGSPENSQMASRLLNFISIACSGQGTSFYRNNYFTQAAFLFEICTFSDGENPDNYYNLARSLAQSGKVKESVAALSAAVDHGFTSRKKVESDPAFVAIRNDARYRELVRKMK